MIRYKNIPVQFDKEQFSSDIRSEFELMKSTGEIGNIEEFAVLLLNVDKSLIAHYMSQSWVQGDGLPLMGNFITVCNALGFDPRKYFLLDE